MQVARFRRQLRKAEKHLRANCEHLGPWTLQYGRCELVVQWERDLYEALVRAIAHQQLHAKAAQAILGRLLLHFNTDTIPSPTLISRTKPEVLRELGFSMSKVVAIQGIAQAAIDGEIPERSLAEQMSDEELIERLIGLRGVGRWTVEMLLIFTLGRLDVMPVDDFGVKSGLAKLYRLPTLPRKNEFAELTRHWAPYRSVAAWYLWRLAEDKDHWAGNQGEQVCDASF